MYSALFSILIGILFGFPETDSLTWTGQPANPTEAIEGNNVVLTWNYALTTDEEANSQNFFLIQWFKFNSSSLMYDQIASKQFFSIIDPPFSYMYQEPLSPHIEIDKNHKADSVTLHINDVKIDDEGQYKIRYVKDIGGNVLYELAMNLTVRDPPSNIVTSSVLTVSLYEELSLNCLADGRPKPTITWTRLSENTIVSMPLNISSRQYGGYYRCTADNGVGRSLTKDVFIYVLFPPVITIESKLFVGREQTASLNCKVEGNPTPWIHWTPCDLPSIGCNKQYLNISKVQTSRANYTCTASNYVGNHSETTLLIIGGTNIFISFSTSGECDKKDSVWGSLQNELAKVFANTQSYIGAELIADVRCGSLIFDVVLKFNTQTAEDVIISTIQNAIVDGMLGELIVNVSSIIGIPPVPLPTTTQPLKTTPKPESEKCTCSCTLFVIVTVILAAINIGLTAYIIWLHRRGTGRQKRAYQESSYENATENTYEQKLQDDEARLQEYQKKIREYEEKIETVNKENDELRNSHKQARIMVKEMESKLSFSQDQVLRLSRELADVQSQCGDYYVLEPESDQDESGIHSCETNGLRRTTSLETDTSTVTPTPMSPDRLADVFDDDDDDTEQYTLDQPAEIRVKRTSSGKSPSKIPRYVGNLEDHRAAQISYYMSLKRGQQSPGSSQAKFFLQVQDLHNPYAHLISSENISRRTHYDSQSTVNSELDNDSETYLEPVDLVQNENRFHAQLGELVSLHFDRRSLAPSVTKTEQDVLSDRSSLCSLTDQSVVPNPIYQTIEPELESTTTRVNEPEENLSLVGKQVVPSSPPPAVPPRFESESVLPPPVPPVPKSNKGEVVRTESNFTSYLAEAEIQAEESCKVNSKEDSTDNVGLAQIATQAWMWNDSDSETPPYGTLETANKDLNMLMEQSCPVYTTLKGTASQLRNTPFSGESTDSSDNESTAGDYCTPPEELSPAEERSQAILTTDEVLEGSTQVLKTCATYTTVSLKKGDQKKEGYLTKLGGRVKNWKRRWFVLTDGKLYYYKTQNDVNRKPLGQIPLDGTCRIARTDGALTFEVTTPKRTFYLTGDTKEVVDDWLRVLHNVMRKFSSTPLFAQVTEKEVMKGWLTKVKHGTSKKCWTVLRGQYLCYYKSEDDMVPFSMTHMIDVIVEELGSPDPADGLDSEAVPYRHYSLVMKSLKQPANTYLLIDSKEEKDSWLFHLKVASGSGIDDLGTEFERHIFDLISQDCDPESETWNRCVLTHVKETITEPLTTLPSKELEKEALKLFKSIHLFTTVQTEGGAAIDYHVSLAQNALQICLDHPELQNEVYCQLIKQTSKHVHRGPDDIGHFLEYCGKSSWLQESAYDISSQATIDLRPVQEFVFIQAWQLLSLCTALFVPKQKFFLFLKGHLNRCSTSRTNQGKYASHCLKNITRTLANGKREARPSRMEVLSALLRKPYDHSCSMSIPVHFIDGTSQVFGFDGSTTVDEFTQTINRVVGIRPPAESGYALFTDNPTNLVEHCLQASVKLCDVISKWEQAMRQSQGRLDTSRMIKLSYKKRLHFKSLSSTETDKEKFFLVLQTNANVMKARFPVSKEMALEFAALMAQITYGDYRAHSNSLPSKRVETVISQFCAKALKEDIGKSSLTLRMAEKWSTLHGWSQKECVDKYLDNARRWPFFGCKLFQAQQKHTVSAAKKRATPLESAQPVWLAVEEDSISILEAENLRLMCRYRYKHVVTFGGWKEDFMLVVNQSIMRGGNTVEQGTQRLLFVMPSRGKILEVTLLMASYINAIIRQKGITCDVTDTGPASRKGMDVKVWDLESAEWPMVPGSTVGLL